MSEETHTTIHLLPPVGEPINPETPDSELTISQITQRINVLRHSVDNLHEAGKPSQKLLREFAPKEAEIKQAYQKAMEDLLIKKQALQANIDEMNELISSRQLEINRLLALQAELLAKQQASERISKLIEDLQVLFENLETWPMVADFQKEAVFECLKAYREGSNGFAIFDEMGLGKSLQAFLMILALKVEFEKEFGRPPKVLWLTKKNLIQATVKELYKWIPQKTLFALPLYGSENAQTRELAFDIITSNDAVMITNYEVVNTMELVRSTEWDIVIIDECHKLKGGANPNGQTKIFKNTLKVVRQTRFILLLSGTPMVNKPEEMWSYLHIFDPERFPSLRDFERSFKVFNSSLGDYVISAEKLLTGALKGKCIRRRKDEVGIQLPDIMMTPRFLTMEGEQANVYEMMRSYFFVILNKQSQKTLSANAVIAQLTRLRQIAVYPAGIETTVLLTPDDDAELQLEESKLVRMALDCKESVKVDEAMEIIEELNDADEQVVVFCTFNAPLFEIQRRCTDKGISCATITGATKRTDLQDVFQQGIVKVLAVNLAVGEGMNLQKNPGVWPGGSCNVILMDRWWTPARNEQAIARVHRMGAHDAVTVHDLHCTDSVDQFIQMMLEEKSAAFANILEREEIRPAKNWLNELKGNI